MQLLRGLDMPAWSVGLARGVLEAVVIAAIGALIIWLSSSDLPEGLMPWAPVLILALRTLEGVADSIDSKKDRTDEGF